MIFTARKTFMCIRGRKQNQPPGGSVLSRIVLALVAALLAAMLNGCGEVSVLDCAPQEWTEAAVGALPLLRPRGSVDLGTEINMNDSTCPSVSTAFGLPGVTAAEARASVRRRALATGWQLDPATRCMRKLLAGVSTGLDVGKDDPGIYFVEALSIAEVAMRDSCIRGGFVR